MPQDIPKRQQYWCPSCNRNHYTDTDIGKKHMYKKPRIKQLSYDGVIGELEERAFWNENEYAIINHLNKFWRLYKQTAEDEKAQKRFNKNFKKGKIWKAPNGEWRFYFNMTETDRKHGRQSHLQEEKVHDKEWEEAMKDPDLFLKKYEETHKKK